MGFIEEFDIEEWKQRFSEFDYPAAAMFLQYSDTKSLKNRYLNLCALARQYVPDKLRKFNSFNDNSELNESKLRTLEKGCIYLAETKSLNDPLDCCSTYYDYEKNNRPTKYKDSVEGFMSCLSNMIRICSFTACDVQSMPMWAHYSNNHHGFCVSYSIEADQSELLKKFVYPIQYANSRLDITEIIDEQFDRSFHRHLEPNGFLRRAAESQLLAYTQIMLYNIKHVSWKYEQEYRLSVPNNMPGLPELCVKPKELYIGINCPDKYSGRLVSIGKALCIPVYKMKRDFRTTTFDLVAEQIV